MSYGLNVYRSTGALGFSSADVTWNQVDSFQVNGGSSASNTYSVLSGKTVLTVQMFIDPPSTSAKSIAHTVSQSGNTINVSGGNQNTHILVLMK
tara:strand:+ start:88 stop:369 length:282 start_codon:yes stop_codon:yes gene_type:complete